MSEQLDDSFGNNSFDESRYSIVTSHNEDINLLTEMGFNNIVVKKVYAFLRPNNIEQAINYLAEENGVYMHNFYEDNKHRNKTKCYICGEHKNKHMDYIPLENEDIIENNNNENNNNGNKLVNHIDSIELNVKMIDNSNNDIQCIICSEYYNEKDFVYYDKCNHSFCYNCWYNYIKGKIENSSIESIKCMNYECKEILTEEFIYKFIGKDKNLVDKYKKLQFKLEILKNDNKKFCPIPNCEGYAEKKNNKYVKCNYGHEFCFECLKKPHGDKKCDNDDEENFKIWKKNKIIKQCPKCKMWTEKNEGCNHMTCIECRYQWCWLCGKECYGGEHYRSGKCEGLWFYKPKSEKDIEDTLNDPNSINRNVNGGLRQNRNNNRRFEYVESNHFPNCIVRAGGKMPFNFFKREYEDINLEEPCQELDEHMTFLRRILLILMYLFLTPIMYAFGMMSISEFIFFVI